MGLFTNVVSDGQPTLVLSIDFNNYAESDKLSTLARKYFNDYIIRMSQPAVPDADGNISQETLMPNMDINDFFADILFNKLKDKMRQEIDNGMVQQQIQAIIQGRDSMVNAINQEILTKL